MWKKKEFFGKPDSPCRNQCFGKETVHCSYLLENPTVMNISTDERA
jgi:hypothetical protein